MKAGLACIGLVVVWGCGSSAEPEYASPSGRIDPTLKKDEPVDAGPVAADDRAAIVTAVKASDAIAEGLEFEVEVVEVSGDWACAVVVAAKQNLDNAQVLLKKDGGWKVLDLGTSLDGAEFGLPKDLAEKWGM